MTIYHFSYRSTCSGLCNLGIFHLGYLAVRLLLVYIWILRSFTGISRNDRPSRCARFKEAYLKCACFSIKNNAKAVSSLYKRTLVDRFSYDGNFSTFSTESCNNVLHRQVLRYYPTHGRLMAYCCLISSTSRQRHWSVMVASTKKLIYVMNPVFDCCFL